MKFKILCNVYHIVREEMLFHCMHFVSDALIDWVQLSDFEGRGGEIGDKETLKHGRTTDDEYTQCVGIVWQVEGRLDFIIVPLHLEGMAFQAFAGAGVTYLNNDFFRHRH